MTINSVHLRRIDAGRNMHRFYELDVRPDLFGHWAFIVTPKPGGWGAILGYLAGGVIGSAQIDALIEVGRRFAMSDEVDIELTGHDMSPRVNSCASVASISENFGPGNLASGARHSSFFDDVRGRRIADLMHGLVTSLQQLVTPNAGAGDLARCSDSGASFSTFPESCGAFCSLRRCSSQATSSAPFRLTTRTESGRSVALGYISPCRYGSPSLGSI
jgi:hypothetical protein